MSGKLFNLFPITEAVNHFILVMGSGLLAFVIAFLAAPPFIRLLHRFKLGKTIREIASDGKEAKLFNELHKHKKGTPTMGGILIWGTTLAVIALSRLLSLMGLFEHSLLNRKETYLPIFTLLAVATLGAVDDLFNIWGLGRSKGLNIKPKLFWLVLLGALGAWWFYSKLGYHQIHFPGIGDFFVGAWIIPLFLFIFVGLANAVNFTDGLDGLAGGLIIASFGAYSGIAYMQGLMILSAFCAVICGSTLAFLWFNVAPARFYMGETGSIALGATLGVIAMLTNTVVVLPLISFVFGIEILSVIFQLTSKKLFKKKLFHIAPLHHHLEYIGWPETQVVMRFWIIGFLFAGLGLLLGILGMGNTTL